MLISIVTKVLCWNMWGLDDHDVYTVTNKHMIDTVVGHDHAGKAAPPLDREGYQVVTQDTRRNKESRTQLKNTLTHAGTVFEKMSGR